MNLVIGHTCEILLNDETLVLQMNFLWALSHYNKLLFIVPTRKEAVM